MQWPSEWPGILPHTHTVTRSNLDLQDSINILHSTYNSRPPSSISTFNTFQSSRLPGLLHIVPVTASGILTRIRWWWVQPYPSPNLELHNWEIRIIINLSIYSIFDPIRLLKYTPGAWDHYIPLEIWKIYFWVIIQKCIWRTFSSKTGRNNIQIPSLSPELPHNYIKSRCELCNSKQLDIRSVFKEDGFLSATS